MNSKLKRRLTALTGIIVIVLIVVLAIVGGATSAKRVSVAEASSDTYIDKKIQVEGHVVDNSFTINGNVLEFSIYDKQTDLRAQHTLRVRYEGGVSSTFGNDVIAICTGRMDEQQILHCATLVTKCPSKYENSTDALSVSRLLKYGKVVQDKPVRLTGDVKENSLQPVDANYRFVLVDPATKEEINVKFKGALSENIKAGTTLVITGALTAELDFNATDVAMKG